MFEIILNTQISQTFELRLFSFSDYTHEAQVLWVGAPERS